jgi:hypothetical protein
MNQFKFLKITNFEPHLKLYALVAVIIQKENSELELDQSNQQELSKHRLGLLVESTFLQIYAELEASLYYECKEQLIKKKASLSRFESALKEQGFTIDNEYWHTLLSISKIRNCLLHGNGRLDSDQYGQDTKDTINQLNSDASTSLIVLINNLNPHKESSEMKIQPSFLSYCYVTINHFLNAQLAEPK